MSNSRTLNGYSIFKFGAYSATSKLKQMKQNNAYIFLRVATVRLCMVYSLLLKKRRKKKKENKEKREKEKKEGKERKDRKSEKRERKKGIKI